MRGNRLPLSVAGICGWLLVSGPAYPDIRWVETETPLGTVPDKASETRVSQDGRRVAAIVPRRGWNKQSLLQHVTFGGLKSNPARMFVDGELSREYRLVDAPSFSPDGKHFAYIAMLSPEEFKGPRPESLPKKLGPFVAVIDGEAGPLFPVALSSAPTAQTPEIVFTPEGRAIYQVADRQGEVRLMADRTETDSYPGVVLAVVYSSDGKRRAVVVKRDETLEAFIDGKTVGEFDDIGLPKFSPDGRHWALIALQDENWFLLVDGEQKQRRFPWIWRPVFSPDGEHIAHWAKEGEDKLMVLDGATIGRGEFLEYSFSVGHFAEALGPVFSPDSRGLAYVLKEGKDSHLVVGESRTSLQKRLPFGLAFSPDGKRFAYAMFDDVQESLFVVIDGESVSTGFRCANRLILGTGLSGGVFGMIPPVFSPDSRHVAFLRTKKARNWDKGGPNLQVVIDGVGSSYFDTLHALGWEQPESLWAVVERGGRYLRLEMKLEDQPTAPDPVANSRDRAEGHG